MDINVSINLYWASNFIVYYTISYVFISVKYDLYTLICIYWLVLAVEGCHGSKVTLQEVWFKFQDSSKVFSGKSMVVECPITVWFLFNMFNFSSSFEYDQIGTIVDSPLDYYTGRLTKRERKTSIAEEFLSDQKSSAYR